MSYDHKNRKVLLLFKQLERRGFVIHQSKKGAFKIVPPRSMGGPTYYTHGTTACLFPLQRFLRDTFGVIVH
ncbi:hypothetical protein EBZ80_14545 [bacterium]|nr:hypothetical protein [bacterium]